MTVGVGAYSASWNNLAIGNVQVGGFRRRYSWNGKGIQFDNVGAVDVDTLLSGLQMYIDFVCMEYNAPAIASMSWPFFSIRGQMPVAGQSTWRLAQPFIMNACLDVDAGGVNPATIIFPKTILAPQFDVSEDFSGVNERMLPFRLIVYPIRYNSELTITAANVNTLNDALVAPKLEMPNGCGEMVYFLETNWP